MVASRDHISEKFTDWNYKNMRCNQERNLPSKFLKTRLGVSYRL